ncbi:hypothetical protein [Sporolactobacillus sp. KGMB 08714]|uniref:hypothetical protein n=1 Tax=Sporolactobacillus sp. KGMB 08714 TaxID=3064704 RepID=UPI002FBD8F76
MIVKLKDQKVKLDQPSVQDVLKLIRSQLDADTFYSCLIADGRYIYEDYAAYITQHLPEIGELEVVTQPLAQMLYNNLVSARDYLERALAELPPLSEHFYSGPAAADWQAFADFLQGLEWIGKLARTISAYPNDQERAGHFLHTFSLLSDRLGELAETVAVQDAVAIADCLQYELLPQIAQLKDAIGTLMIREGTRRDPA